MKTKIFKILLIGLLVTASVFLGGCQKKCPKASNNVPGTETFRPDCPYKVEEAEKPTSMDLYIIYDNTDAFAEQLQAFESNVGMKVNVKKFVNPAEYEDLVINEIAEGKGPDVFMINNSWITKHWKKLLPLPADHPRAMPADVFRQTFFQAAADDLIIDEKIYGMPLSLDNLAIYYNKQVFKDLIATSDRPGALWEDIKEQVFQLTKRDNSPERFALSGMAIGRADNVSSGVDILYALMQEYGAVFYDEKEENAIFSKGALPNALIEKPGVEALTLFTSFALPSYKNYTWNDLITGYAPDEKEVNPFARGKVAMIIGYPYMYDMIVKSIQDQQRKGEKHMAIEDIGIAPFPQLVSSTEATRRDTLASYFPLVVARTTDSPVEAWTLVQYLTTADSLQTYHKKTKRPTSRKDMVTEQQTEPLFGVFAYQAPFAKSIKIYDAASYYKVFSDAIDSVVKNVATPDKALKDAQDKISCIIKKQKDLIGQDTDCKL
jgi:ABC-type glycerol-3-phosphate transport system substrate-binding protein